MARLYIKFEGRTPLLTHNPVGSMSAVGESEEVKKKKIPPPDVEAKASRYITPDGNFYIPALNVRNSILCGSKGYKIGKFSALTILSGAIDFIDDKFPLLRDGKPISGDDYTIDIRRVVVQRRGIMRARAMIALPWQIEAVFSLNPDLATVEQIKKVAQNAGLVCGLLDYRPEKKVGLPGPYGKYAVADIWSE